MITALVLSRWVPDETGAYQPHLRGLFDYTASGEECRDVTDHFGNRMLPDRNVIILRITLDNATAIALAADTTNLHILHRFDTHSPDSTLTAGQRAALRTWLQNHGLSLAEIQEWAGTDANLAALTRAQIFSLLRTWLRNRPKAT